MPDFNAQMVGYIEPGSVALMDASDPETADDMPILAKAAVAELVNHYFIEVYLSAFPNQRPGKDHDGDTWF